MKCELLSSNMPKSISDLNTTHGRKNKKQTEIKSRHCTVCCGEILVLLQLAVNHTSQAFV